MVQTEEALAADLTPFDDRVHVWARPAREKPGLAQRLSVCEEIGLYVWLFTISVDAERVVQDEPKCGEQIGECRVATVDAILDVLREPDILPRPAKPLGDCGRDDTDAG